MSYDGRNSNMPGIVFESFQAEVDRILERAGSFFFCEEEEEIDMVTIESVNIKKMEFNAMTYTRYPALIHGKYSIPKIWVADEDVAKTIIREDTTSRRFLGRCRNVLYHLQKELSF